MSRDSNNEYAKYFPDSPMLSRFQRDRSHELVESKNCRGSGTNGDDNNDSKPSWSKGVGKLSSTTGIIESSDKRHSDSYTRSNDEVAYHGRKPVTSRRNCPVSSSRSYFNGYNTDIGFSRSSYSYHPNYSTADTTKFSSRYSQRYQVSSDCSNKHITSSNYRTNDKSSFTRPPHRSFGSIIRPSSNLSDLNAPSNTRSDERTTLDRSTTSPRTSSEVTHHPIHLNPSRYSEWDSFDRPGSSATAQSSTKADDLSTLKLPHLRRQSISCDLGGNSTPGSCGGSALGKENSSSESSALGGGESLNTNVSGMSMTSSNLSHTDRVTDGSNKSSTYGLCNTIESKGHIDAVPREEQPQMLNLSWIGALPSSKAKRGLKLIYDPETDCTLDRKKRKELKPKYEDINHLDKKKLAYTTAFSLQNSGDVRPDPRLTNVFYTNGKFQTPNARHKLRLRIAPYILKEYSFDAKTSVNSESATGIVISGLDPFTPQNQIVAYFSSYGEICELINHTDPTTGSLLGICSIKYRDQKSYRGTVTGAQSAKRAEKFGNGQYIGLQRVCVARDLNGRRSKRLIEETLRKAAEERMLQANNGDVNSPEKKNEPTHIKDQDDKEIRMPNRSSERYLNSTGTGRLSNDSYLQNLPLLAEELRWKPYIHISCIYVPVHVNTINPLKKRFRMYDFVDIKLDVTGYWIIFEDSKHGERECARCFKECSQISLFNRVVKLECSRRGRGDVEGKPRWEDEAEWQRLKERILRDDRSEWEEEMKRRAECVDPVLGALEILVPQLRRSLVNDVKKRIVIPALVEFLNRDELAELRIKRGIGLEGGKVYDNYGVLRYGDAWNDESSIGLRSEINELDKERHEEDRINDKLGGLKYSGITSKRFSKARGKSAVDLYRYLHDTDDSDGEDEDEFNVNWEERKQSNLTKGEGAGEDASIIKLEEANKRARDRIEVEHDTEVEGGDDAIIEKNEISKVARKRGRKKRKQDADWMNDISEETVDESLRNALGDLVYKNVEIMARGELEQLLMILPADSCVRNRIQRELEGIERGAESEKLSRVDEYTNLGETTGKKRGRKNKGNKGIRGKKRKIEDEGREEVCKVKEEHLVEERGEAKLPKIEDKCKTDMRKEWDEIVNEREKRGIRDFDHDKFVKSAHDDVSDEWLDLEGWQRLVKDEEDLEYVKKALELICTEQSAADILDISVWAWQEMEFKRLHGGFTDTGKNYRSIEGYYVKNISGCARTEKVGRIAESEKSRYLPHRLKVAKAREERVANAQDQGSCMSKDKAAVNDTSCIDDVKKSGLVNGSINTNGGGEKRCGEAESSSNLSSRGNRALNRRLVNEFKEQKKVYGDGEGGGGKAQALRFNQLKKRKKRVKFDRSAIHNWGLYAEERICANDMIIEYVGEIIRSSVANVRERRYDRAGVGSSYLFRIDEEYVVDATKLGGIARFINHSCSPNCTARIIKVEGTKRIVIYAARDIVQGEEITYDYKFEREFESNDRVPCLCGSIACKGFLN